MGGGSYTNISAKSGLGDSACSHPYMFNDPLSSNGSMRFCDVVITSLVTFASRRTSGLSRIGTGAASAKLTVESIRRVRVSILCCRIFVGCVLSLE